MKLIIAGDRNVTDIRIVKEALLQFHNEHPDFKVTEIVSGCARGVDTLGERIAEEYNIPVKKFPADWEKFGKAAGPIRNIQMAEYADGLVAVLVETSKGTRSMIKEATKRNLIISIKEI